MLAIKENITSSPMLFLSRHNNIKNKEVHYVQARTTLQYRCAYLSATLTPSHESFSHGPLFSEAPKQRKKRWTWPSTIFQAILMAYDQSASLKDRFQYARQCLMEMFPRRRRPGKTYQGFVKAVRRIPAKLREQLQAHLCRQHQKAAGRFWEIFGWIPFAADGSRVELPRTEANQKAFGCAGRNKTGPQLLLTVLYHLGSGLPWRWKIGAGADSERGLLRKMLLSLPRHSLLIADAGFVGYDFLKAILRHQVSFLIRAGANVTLLTGLGFEFRQRGKIVWLWPQGKRDQAPLQLRLIQVKQKSKQFTRKQTVYLLTNVLDTERLSDTVAGVFYKMRWGVELFYRSFKQTLEHRKMRSGSPALALEELHWSLTALLLLGLMGVDALVSHQRDPSSLSVAAALRKVRFAMRTSRCWRYRGDLRVLLVKAVKDNYNRQGSKTARDWAHKKKESPPGAPKIRPATSEEIACAKRIYKVA
jgi:hypothetical protein